MTTKILKFSPIANQKWTSDVEVSDCPFCHNGHIQSVSYSHAKVYSVYCQQCGFIGPRGKNIEMAINYWNSLGDRGGERVKMVFLDWQKVDEDKKQILSVYDKNDGVELSSGDFHSGTTFDAYINLDFDQKNELQDAIARGYMPCFYLVSVKHLSL